MSLTNEWTEYHLTPAGWVMGTVKLDFGDIKEQPAPKERVLTLCFHEYQSCSYASEDRWYEIIWESMDNQKISELSEKYGTTPNYYENYKLKGRY